MKVVFLSNYYNHHQSAFSEAMYKKTGGEYAFIETTEIPQFRLALGYGQNSKPDFVKKYGEDAEKDKEIEQLIEDADVVVIGSAPQNLIDCRIQKKKLTFQYSERIFKKGFSLKKEIGYLGYRILYHQRVDRAYMLCASAYTAADYAKFFTYKKKTYKWGYFPELKSYDVDSLMENKQPSSILWVGRFIDWKHPEIPVFVAKKLKEEGYSFSLNLIGTGELEETIGKEIEANHLEDCVHLLGSMKPEQVREYMEKAEIYLFTSDFNEGWGAVLNESMNSGCAVVASHAIGSVPFLLKDGENGMIYRQGDEKGCYQKVKQLIDHPDLRKQMGEKAYLTLYNEWNADVAAERLLKLSSAILAGEKHPQVYESGPCSEASILQNNWLGK